MIISILPNPTGSYAAQVTREIADELCKLSARTIICGENPDERDEAVKMSDFVIAVGGDGSIIRAAKIASVYGKPVLGVNAGNLAFMAGLERGELGLLKALEGGEYSLDRRMMLDVSCFDGDKLLWTDCCLNDTVLARGSDIRIIEASVECDGILVDKYRTDGLIFSTPTGSTAYSLSAGGPVIEPTQNMIVLTPVCPHSLSARPIIFSENARLKVSVTDYSEAFFSNDGDNAVKFTPGQTAIIKKSDRYADFVRIKPDRFWNVLKNKIH